MIFRRMVIFSKGYFVLSKVILDYFVQMSWKQNAEFDRHFMPKLSVHESE